MQLQNATIQITEEMKPYINPHKEEISFLQRALLLYPYIQNGTISHGRAAEILGVSKWSLIQAYGAIGISYVNMSAQDLRRDIDTAFEAAESK